MNSNDKIELDSLYFDLVGNYRGIIQRLKLRYRLRFSKTSDKLEELIAVIRGETKCTSFKYPELKKIADDIISQETVTPYIIGENILAIQFNGKKASYIAMFNLSKTTVKLYADISSIKDFEIYEGVIAEVFSDLTYLISDGKIYIRKFPSMDCFLFVKNN